jgi:hypothetical protein
MSEDLYPIIRETRETVHADVLALGYLRYEMLRKLHPCDMRLLYFRNMQGENFDQMVDALIPRK